MRLRILLLSLLLSPVPLGVAVASETIALKDTVYSLPEVLVEAERISPVEKLRDRPAFVAIVPLDDVGQRVSSAADYLAQTVGCHVQSTGGYGAYSTASVRGSSAKQVRVYLDGIPLTQAQSGMVDLADLPLASLSRIEIYRGFGPFDLSGSSIGGVINLVTKKPVRGSGHLSASYGSLASRRLQGSYCLSKAGWDVLAIGNYAASRGDFEFLDDNGTPYNPNDDETTKRINNQLEEYETLIKITRQVAGGRAHLSNQLFRCRQGLPGYSAVQSSTERMTKTYDLTHLAWERVFGGHFPWQAQLGIYHLYRLDHFEDRRPKKAGVKPDEENRTVSLGAHLRWQVHVTGYRQTLRGMLALGQESFRPEETFSQTVTGEEQARRTLALSLEDEVTFLAGALKLTPSGRYERYLDDTRVFRTVRADLAPYFRGMTDGRVTRSVKIGTLGLVASPGGGLTLKANYGRHYRIPSLMEVFGYRGMTIPNPSLEPEVGLNRDVGVAWGKNLRAGTLLSAEYVYFWSDVERLIMFVYVPYAQASQAINIDSARIKGCEISLSFGTWHGVTLSGNLTHLDAINTGKISYQKGKHLPQRPETEAFAGLRWRHRGLAIFYEFDYVSGNYWNAANGKAPNNKGPLFPIRRLQSAGITVPAGVPNSSFTLEVRNLQDQRYEDVMGYPLPGRSVHGTLMLSL